MIKICVKKDAKEAEKSASYIIPRKMNFVENCIYNSHWIPVTVMIAELSRAKRAAEHHG